MIKEIKKPFLDQYIPKRRFHFRLFLFVVHCSFSESFSILTVIPLSLSFRSRLLFAACHSDGCSGLWLVQTGHVTSILASYWPLVTPMVAPAPALVARLWLWGDRRQVAGKPPSRCHVWTEGNRVRRVREEYILWNMDGSNDVNHSMGLENHQLNFQGQSETRIICCKTKILYSAH